MENRSFYNEILTEHNLHPEFKHDLPDADIVLEGVNPSCGDDIFLKLKLDGDVITDGAFVGDGCAVWQASADIMLGMIVGKKKEDALKMGEIFLKMIQGEASEDEIDSLEEASALRDIAHMPARVKCAVLGWRTLKEALLDGEEEKITAQQTLDTSLLNGTYATYNKKRYLPQHAANTSFYSSKNRARIRPLPYFRPSPLLIGRNAPKTSAPRPLSCSWGRCRARQCGCC